MKECEREEERGRETKKERKKERVGKWEIDELNKNRGGNHHCKMCGCERKIKW
jgi:hypothetical protein